MIYVVLIFLIYFGFRMNLSTGIIVTVLSLGFAVYKNLPAFYALLGARAYNSGNDEKTLHYYEKSIDTGRADAKIYTTYVLILMRTGKLKKALAVCNAAIASKRIAAAQKYMLKCYRCLIYYKTGEGAEGLADAKKIFENYKNTTVYGLLGYLMLALDEPREKTLGFCLEAYDYNSDDRDITDNLVLAYYKNGELDKAESLAVELVEMSPAFVEAYYHSALIAKALGKTDKAKEFLGNIDNCLRTALTTVSEEEIKNLKKELEG